MEFKGRIFKILPVQSGTSSRGNEWQRQEIVFEYFEHETDRYSDKVVLSVHPDRIEETDLHEGDAVVIGFGHSVREWQGRYFNDVRVYKMEKVGATAKPSPTDKGDTGGEKNAAQTLPQGKGEENQGETAAIDDLPFE